MNTRSANYVSCISHIHKRGEGESSTSSMGQPLQVLDSCPWGSFTTWYTQVHGVLRWHPLQVRGQEENKRRRHTQHMYSMQQLHPGTAVTAGVCSHLAVSFVGRWLHVYMSELNETSEREKKEGVAILLYMRFHPVRFWPVNPRHPSSSQLGLFPSHPRPFTSMLDLVSQPRSAMTFNPLTCRQPR